jgi:hypothetical protein
MITEQNRWLAMAEAEESPRIRVTMFFSTGREQSSHDCDTIQDAFDRCQRSGMLAHAYPVGTSEGIYIWRAEAPNTLEAFTRAMERAK